MLSFKLHLDKRSKKTDGTYPLKIGISFNNSYAMISTGVYLRAEEWDEKSQKVSFSSPQKLLIDKIWSDIQTLLISMRVNGEVGEVSMKEIKDRINYVIGYKKAQPPRNLFINYMKRFADGKTKQNTRDTYLYTLSKVEKFTHEQETELTFEDITYKWLQDFDKFLSETSGINSRSIHMRNIRSVFNEALKEEIIKCYPFRKFRIQSERTQKRSLTVEELVRLRDFPCESHQEKYRDLFMLIFYLIGINMVDLCNLEKINDNIIRYRRAKTGKMYNIKVEPEALDIIEKYKGMDHLIYVLDKYRNYKDFMLRMDDQLKKIGPMKRIGLGGKKVREPILPHITSYWARHTWATIAYNIGISKDTISLALGHEFGCRTTDIYIDYNSDSVDEANRKVIDYVNEYVIEEPEM